MEKFIQHRGIVKNIENNTVFVCIEQQSACSACHARSACLASDKKEKIIEVIDNGFGLKVGDEVIVSVKSSLGMRAVMIAFVMPFLLIMAAVFVGTKSTGDEGLGGLAGLFLLFPYYIVLYILRDKINKKFIFTVSKDANMHTPVIN